MSPDPDLPLSFPDGPKLELDELIDQLMDRAQGVKHAQGRLRTLLKAIELVTGDLSLEAVLKHVVEAACALADARYGALGVIAPDRTLERFIHHGLDDASVARIEHLPRGLGLLGALIADPHPIRLEHLGEDARSAGFPPRHPPMESFLGVPIRVRGEVFGNLYLTESRRQAFSAEDEELVGALATAAGTAISNARLYDESRRQQRWLAASAEIGSQLLAADGEDPLRTIARRASDIADADFVSVGLLTEGQSEIVIEVAVGEAAHTLLGQRFALADSLAGQAIVTGNPVMIRDAAEGVPAVAPLLGSMELGPVLVIPLQGSHELLGVLSLARRRGRSTFSAADMDMATAFADHASLALELAAARADQQRMVLLEDRDRIARDLHDHVIQELFAIGLSLQGAATLADTKAPLAERLHAEVANIDRTIRRIRTSIFELNGSATQADGMRAQVLGIAAELAPALGFSPSVAFSGPVDSTLGGSLADDVLACVREALTNVAKHASASSADVDLSVNADEVTLTIDDNGVGLGQSTRYSGLANLLARAQRRGGSLVVTPSARGGVAMHWKAPVT